jgi:hypothetical protein
MAADRQAQARKVVNSLIERPGLLCEVLDILTDEFTFAGPWLDPGPPPPSGQAPWERRDPLSRTTVTQVSPKGGNGSWNWLICDDPQTKGSAPTLDQAKAAVDLELSRRGYTLG